jgi:histidyl-tRNA synthetase
VMIANFSDEDLPYALNILSILREANIPSEIYPDTQKMKKQFAYADARKIPYVILAGSDERKSGVVAVKNLLTGNQEMIAANELVEYLKES